MRKRRFELAAWEVFECGKPWAEADGDIAEAIDFCEFYAREMCRLAEPRHRDASGETNFTEPIARGVAVVIPPWNFPLAIPTGMTVAALVTGNTVILKPAEQSPVIAWHLARILNEAGLPPGVLNYLPGLGEEAGQALVNHPEVDLIAFTGSREVGLLINRQAAAVAAGPGPRQASDRRDGRQERHPDRRRRRPGRGRRRGHPERLRLRRPEVLGLLAGRSSSPRIHDAFLARLIEAARAVKIGPGRRSRDGRRPGDRRPGTQPRFSNISASPRPKAASSSRQTPATSPAAATSSAPRSSPTSSPTRRVAQEEIFGPVLAVLKATDLTTPCGSPTARPTP